MKVSLRFTLLTVLVGLLVLTVTVLGYNSLANARFTARDLSQQIIDQTTSGVDTQIKDLLTLANTQGELNRRLIETGQQDAMAFPRLAAYWVEVMMAQPRLTRVSIGLEASGDWLYVRRQPDGQLAVGELRQFPRTDRLALRVYKPKDYPNGQPLYSSPDKTEEDPRLRTWYRAGKQAGEQTWSESYVFFGTEGVPDVPGVSCATPVYRDGKLLGVLTSSFDLGEVCRFLKGLKVGKTGYAFVVERKPGREPVVIAHPRPETLLRDLPHPPGKGPVRELVPASESSDPLVAVILPNIPQHFGKDRGARPLPPFAHDGVRYLGAYQPLSVDNPNWVVCVVLPEAEVLGRVEQNNHRALLVALGALAAALLAAVVVSGRVSQPLSQLVRETESISRFRVEARPVAHSPIYEVDRLAVAMEDMKTSLRSFQKFVPADLVRRLLSGGQEAELGGENKTLTIYFCDLAGFTSVSEKLAPEDLIHLLGEYFEALSKEILASGGTVDKYIGDAIMAFWGAPTETPGHALLACATALRNQHTLAALRPKWLAEGKLPLFARIGIHTGEVVVGNFGSPARLNYTVIGDPVNLASRLEGLNKHYETEILISEQTYREAGPGIVARPLDWVSVKGKTEAILVYELLALAEDADETHAAVAQLATAALQKYRERDWAGAIELLEQILQVRREDGPARLLIARCQAYQENPPGEDWDGVHRMESK